jgi:hypothetical protein
MNDHVRPCNLKPQQRDLAPVLRRPVEPAGAKQTYAFLSLIVVAGLLLPRPVVAQPAQRSVLVLDQSSAGLPFNAAVTSAIRSTINAGSRSPTSFYSEHLDANRFFGPEYENEFVQFLKAKYRERHIDVVIVFGVSALDFIARRRERLLLPERPRKRGHGKNAGQSLAKLVSLAERVGVMSGNGQSALDDLSTSSEVSWRCPLLGEQRKTSNPSEYFRVWTGGGHHSSGTPALRMPSQTRSRLARKV